MDDLLISHSVTALMMSKDAKSNLLNSNIQLRERLTVNKMKEVFVVASTTSQKAVRSAMEVTKRLSGDCISVTMNE